MTSAALTLERIVARPVAVPIKRPPRSASGEIPLAPLVLLDLHAREGIVGRSYLFAFAGWALPVIVQCVGAIAEALADSAVAPQTWQRTLAARFRLMDTPGFLGLALAGVDMAAWDAMARAQGLSLSRYLGAEPVKVPAYNSCGLWIQAPEALPDEALALVEEGQYGAVKLRVGRSDAQQDYRAVELVREALPDEVRLMVDFNQSLNTHEAVTRGKVLDQFGLDWIEEPIPHEHYAGYAEIRASINTPIQTGENLLDGRKFVRALEMASLDLVMPDVQRIGGVTGWLHAAGIAEAHDVPMSSHLFPEYSQHLLAATPTQHWLEYMDWANPILTEPVVVRNGVVSVTDSPGAGIEWNEDAVKQFLVT